MPRRYQAGDGTLLEYQFEEPPGWQSFANQRAARGLPRSLPLLIALHERDQDPEQFQRDWSFSSVTRPAAAGQLAAEADQVFVLFPYGQGQDVPRGEVPGVRQVVSRNGAPVDFDITAPRDLPFKRRSRWNAGGSIHPVTGLMDHTLSWTVRDGPRDDGGAIFELVGVLEKVLRSKAWTDTAFNTPWPVNEPIFDPNRIFLFGIGEGGSLAYHLAARFRDWVAALWVMSGAVGGRMFSDLTLGPTPLINDPGNSTTWPGPSSMGVSLVHVHGLKDRRVPPIAPTRSEADQADFVDSGLSRNNAIAYASAPLPLSTAVNIYPAYNRMSALGNSVAMTSITGLPATMTTGTGVTGVATCTGSAWRTSAPGPDQISVVQYLDPEMTDLVPRSDLQTRDGGLPFGGTSAFYNVSDVWSFFKAHPRIVR